MFLWGEVSPQAGGRHGVGVGVGGTQSSPRSRPQPSSPSTSYPYQPSPEVLREGISAILGLQGPGLQDAGSSIFLPTIGDRPVPSSPLVGSEGSSTSTAPGASSPPPSPSLRPWDVRGISMDLGRAVVSMSNVGMQDGAVRRQLRRAATVGVAIAGDDLLFWSTASKLVMEIISRQRFIPYLAQRGGGTQAHIPSWVPLLQDLSDRIGWLAEAMPPVCRAAAGAFDVDPTGLLTDFLDDAVDAAIRFLISRRDLGIRRPGPGPSPSPGSRTPAASWFDGLIGAPRPLPPDLVDGIRSWAQEVYAGPALGPSASSSPLRTCFRLIPPSPPGGAGPWEAAGLKWRLDYLLQSRDDPTLFFDARSVWAGAIPSAGGDARERLLEDLGKASAICRPIERSLRSAAAPDHAELSLEEAHSFLVEDGPILEEMGFGVFAPDWWRRGSSRPRVELAVRAPEGGAGAGALTLRALLEFDWRVAIGEDGAVSLTEEEFRRIAELKLPMAFVGGRWVELSGREFERAVELVRAYRRRGGIPLADAIGLASAGEEGTGSISISSAEGWARELMDGLGAGGAQAQIQGYEVPSGFRGELRPYQLRGASWLAFMRRWGLGACLADDMGLGKTAQVLACLLGGRGPYLVVCPTSIVGNWVAEIRKFAPSLRVMVHHGHGRASGDELAAAAAAGRHDVVITTYSLLHRDIGALRRVRWEAVVLDEAQNIKNPWTKQARAARELDAGWRVALTGTPVENRLSELWSIMDFINPGYLGSFSQFRAKFAAPIERYGDQGARRRLNALIRPFVLRRLKTDRSVIGDLPEKMEMKVLCSLTEEQATLYEAYVRRALRDVEGSEGIRRKGIVLGAITRLKQICDHPALFSGDASRLEGRSGKMERLGEMLEEVLEGGERALVFTQYVEMGEMLKRYIESKFGVEALFLHGELPRERREELISRFQSGDRSAPVFVMSIRAGGLGLNLTSATHVFHYDRWWNPAVEDQATDRAFRIGQTRRVEVHKLIAAGTLEERIDEMLEAKRGLAESVIGRGDEWLTELSTEELRSVLELRREAGIGLEAEEGMEEEKEEGRRR